MRTAEKILVVGGAGYIGSCLIPLLLKDGYEVRVFDNFLFGDAGLAPVAQSPQLEIIEGDICDVRALNSAMRGSDAVILLAALVGHRAKDGQWTDMRNTNLLASNVVLDSALEHGVHRFIFASTNSVYGLQAGVMYETSIPEPVSLYSRLKLRLEERIIRKRQRDFHPTALRIATCNGFAPRMRFDLLANSLLRDAVCRKQIVISNVDQWRAQIHVEDAARAFLACIKAHTSLISGEIFNVGASDQNVQISQVLQIIKELVPDCDIQEVNDEPELIDYRLSCAKLERVLEFKPQWTLQGSLEQMYDKLKEGYFGDPYSLRYANT